MYKYILLKTKVINTQDSSLPNCFTTSSFTWALELIYVIVCWQYYTVCAITQLQLCIQWPRQLEIHRSGSIYTTETGKCYKSGLFPLFGWLSRLEKVMEKRQTKLNVTGSCYIVNSKKKKSNNSWIATIGGCGCMSSIKAFCENYWAIWNWQ